jgi:hypothetical protein
VRSTIEERASTSDHQTISKDVFVDDLPGDWLGEVETVVSEESKKVD